MSRLRDRVAIVTGGACGLGAEIATLFAAHGARVVIGDIRDDEGQSTASSIRGAGGDALFMSADVTEGEQVKDLVSFAVSHYGKLDVMVANAGVLGPMGLPLADISEEAFETVIRVNLLGAFYCFKYAIPAIERVEGGSMIATTSVAAHRGVPRLEPYSASKAAITGLVRSLASDLAPRIRVNCVSPGRIRTDIVEHAAAETGRKVSIPPRRVGSVEMPSADPSAVAGAFLFLASDEASYITGQTLRVDGGRSVFDI